jgi:hypothetical protein
MSSGAGLPPGTKAVKAGKEWLIVPERMTDEEVLGLLNKGVMSGLEQSQPPAPPTEDQLVAGAETPGYKGPTSGTEAFGAGAAGTALMGWGDEIAGGLDPENESKTYERRTERARSEHPIPYYAGAAAGLVPGLALSPVTGTARLIQGGVGAIGGAVSGAGEGDTTAQRATNAAVGGVVGGVAGAISPELAVLFNAAAKKLGFKAVQSVADALTEGGINEQQARQFLEDATRRGQPATLGDVAPTTAGREAQLAANVSPTAQSHLATTLAARSDPDARVQRFRTFISDPAQGIGTGETSRGTREALENRARALNDPAYRAAYSAPTAASVDVPDTLLQSAAVREAIQNATATGSDLAASSGRTLTPRNPYRVVGDRLELAPGASPPSLEFWDHVQRNLRSQAGVAGRSGDDEAARRIGDLRRTLTQHLDNTVPEFGRARTGAAGFFGEENALDVGKQLGRGGLSDPETFQDAQAAIARMNPAERQLLRSGFMDEVSHRAGKSDIGNPAVRAIGGPNDRAAARLVLGDAAADRLIAFGETERAMQAFQHAALGGPSTARQLTDVLRQTLPGIGGAGAAAQAASSLTSGAGVDQIMAAGGKAALGYGAGLVTALAAEGLQKAQAVRIARIMLSEDPRVRQRVFDAMRASPVIRNGVAKVAGMISAKVGDTFVTGEDQ